MKLKNIIIGVLLITVFKYTNAFSQTIDEITRIDDFLALTSKDDWKVVKETEGVTLKYRWLYIGDSIKTRELSLCYETSQNSGDVLRKIKEPLKIKEWNSSVRSHINLENNESNWVSHTIFDIPYPFTQQDLVVFNVQSDKNGITTIYMHASADFIAQKEGVERQRFYLGSWVLTPKYDNLLEVKFSAISLSTSKIPRFIRDPIIHNRILNSFVKMKEQTSSKKQFVSFNNSNSTTN